MEPQTCQLEADCDQPAIARITVTSTSRVHGVDGRIGMALIRPLTSAMRSGVLSCLDHVHLHVDLLLMAAQPGTDPTTEVPR